MSCEDTDLLRATAGVALKEHLDAFVLVGYTADRHKRIVVAEHGSDPACSDGLQIMAAAAQRWAEGGLNRGQGTGSSEQEVEV